MFPEVKGVGEGGIFAQTAEAELGLGEEGGMAGDQIGMAAESTQIVEGADAFRALEAMETWEVGEGLGEVRSEKPGIGKQYEVWGEFADGFGEGRFDVCGGGGLARADYGRGRYGARADGADCG